MMSFLRLFLGVTALALPAPWRAVAAPGCGSPPTRDTVLVVGAGDHLSALARRYLDRSPYYTRFELIDSVRRINDLQSDTLRIGQRLVLPLRRSPPANRPLGHAAGFRGRGIYLPAAAAGTREGRECVERFRAVGGNTVVFDVKDRLGQLGYDSRVPLAIATGAAQRPGIQQPAKLVEFLHQLDMHAVARLVCFCDVRLASARPDLAPSRRDTQSVYSETEGPAWVEPSLPEVQAYLLQLVDEVAAMGVDEIQLDYVRYPAEGDEDASVFEFGARNQPRHVVINRFVAAVRERLAGTGVLLAADLFGVAAWTQHEDMPSTGQQLSGLLPHLDVVCPMLYPSHFYGRFGRISRPVDCPRYLIAEGCRRVGAKARAEGVAVRPWLQAFAYRIPDFGAEYVVRQIQGAEAGDSDGWMLWNPGGRYGDAMEALALLEHGTVPGMLKDSVDCPERAAGPEAGHGLLVPAAP